MRAPARRRWSPWLRALVLGAAVLAPVGGAVLAGPAPKKPGPVHGGSFPARHAEYVALAAEGSDASLELLLASYRRPGREETERARIVTLACDGFVGRDMTAPFKAWRERDATFDDSWLWYRTLRRQVGASGAEDAYAVARDGKRPPYLRAAAVRALAAWADPGLLRLVADLGNSDLGKGPGRALLVEALGAALASEAGRIGSPELRAAFDALIPFLEPDAVEPRTRLALARSLARLFALPRPFVDVRRYAALLDQAQVSSADEPGRYALPRFFDIEATGDRVVYVVDVSGSMGIELTESERKDLRERLSVPVTGSAGAADPTASLPWEHIRSRRDVAIECTKASIAALPEDASFAVLLFESTVRPLKGTADPSRGVPDLLQATKANVAAARKALDLEREGGATNLHGGLRRAFDVQTTRKGRPTGPAGELEALVRGPTTIFLLTDGAPCCDDWGFAANGLAPTVGSAGSSEVGGAPYTESVSICDDLERMNLLRGCEIHAVGIGEFSPGLLDRIAHVGHGKVRRIGAPSIRVETEGMSAREQIRLLQSLGLPVPDSLRALADKEGKATPPVGMDGGAPAPDAKDPTTPEQWLASLREAKSTEARVDAIHHLGSAKHAPALPDLLRLLAEDFHDDVQEACIEALRVFAGRDFGWMPGLPVHEREAARRNWAWWGELHRGLWEPPK